jgi:hypothetical protein
VDEDVADASSMTATTRTLKDMPFLAPTLAHVTELDVRSVRATSFQVLPDLT